jgi:hypothetical protein
MVGPENKFMSKIEGKSEKHVFKQFLPILVADELL